MKAGNFIALILVSLLVPAILGTRYLYLSFIEARYQFERVQLQESADILIRGFDQEIKTAHVFATILSKSQALRDGNIARFKSNIETLSIGLVDGVTLATDDGTVVAMIGPGSDDQIDSIAVHLTPIRDRLRRGEVVEQLVRTLRDGRWAIILTFPVEMAGAPMALRIVIFSDRLKVLFEPFTDPVRAQIVTPQGLIAGGNGEVSAALGTAPPPEVWRMLQAGSRRLFPATDSPQNLGPERTGLYAYARSERSGWYALVGIPGDHLYAEARQAALLHGAVTLAALALGLLASAILGQVIVARLRALERYAARVGSDLGQGGRPAFLVKELDAVAAALERTDAAMIGRTHRLMQLTVEADEARREAEAANAAKSRFLAAMSHELRTPLNHIIGFSELIEHRVFGPSALDRYAAAAADIHAGGERLLRVVNDVLAIANLDRSAVELALAPLDFADLWQQCALPLLELAGTRGVRLTFGDNDSAVTFLADKLRLAQALERVVENAILFSPQGGIVRIDAGQRIGADGTAEIVVQVNDNGPGMSPETVARLGMPFEQAEGVMARRHQGMGLGLALARGLLALHGGRLDISSTQGVGTRVELVLPLTTEPKPDSTS